MKKSIYLALCCSSLFVASYIQAADNTPTFPKAVETANADTIPGGSSSTLDQDTLRTVKGQSVTAARKDLPMRPQQREEPATNMWTVAQASDVDTPFSSEKQARLSNLPVETLPCDYLRSNPDARLIKDPSGKIILVDAHNLLTRLTVDQPAEGSEAVVGADGTITLSGELNKIARLLDASVGEVTSTTVTLGDSAQRCHLCAWTDTWTVNLRPAKLGTQDLCVRAEKLHGLIRAHVFRSVVVADHTPPSTVSGLRVSDLTSDSATLSWDAATDNFSLTGYEVSVDGGTAHSLSSDTLSYHLSGLEASTSYAVAVVAIDQAGNRSASPTTTSFTTKAPPTAGPISLTTNESGALATWHPGTTDAQYTVLVDGEEWEIFPVEKYCVGATGAPANPCTPTDTIRYTVVPLTDDTAYTLQVVTAPAGGGDAHTETADFRTAAVAPLVPQSTTELIVRESQQCVASGGSFYLSPSQRGRVPIPAGAQALFAGCYKVADSSCVDRELPVKKDGELDCSDDVTKLVSNVAPPGHGPSIDSPDAIALAPGVLCLESSCITTFVSAAEAIASEAIAVEAGFSLATIAAVAGKVIVAVAFFETLQVVFAEPIAIAGILEYPIHPDTDFANFDNWNANRSQYYNSLQIYAEIIEGSRWFTRDNPFVWTDTRDADLKRTIDQACNAQQQLPMTSTATGCDSGMAIYVPGAFNTYGGALPETNNHIAETMQPYVGLDNPERVPWFNPARSVGAKAAKAKGYKHDWYDRNPLFLPNNCTGRNKPVCDEFPFWRTDQAVNLSGTVASLRPVPGDEAWPQARELTTFFKQCQVKDGERFLIIPIKDYVAAGGPSFGFRVGNNETELCYGLGL